MLSSENCLGQCYLDIIRSCSSSRSQHNLLATISPKPLESSMDACLAANLAVTASDGGRVDANGRLKRQLPVRSILPASQRP